MKNEYILDSDLKRKMNSVIPAFVQYDKAVLIFRIFDNGVPIDLSTVTHIEVVNYRPDRKAVIGTGEITTLPNGEKAVQYTYLGSEMKFVGTNKVGVSIFHDKTKISLLPFDVKIVEDYREATFNGAAEDDLGLLTQLIESVQSTLEDANETLEEINDKLVVVDGKLVIIDEKMIELDGIIYRAEVATTDAIEATTNAIAATNHANTQGDYAKEQGEFANEKGTFANTQGEFAKTQGEFAQTQGNHALTQGNYAKEQGDYAKDTTDNIIIENANLQQIKTEATQATADAIDATVDAIQATEDAITATTNANTQAAHAKTQGDFAKAQGEFANEKGTFANTQGEFAKTQGELAQQATADVIASNEDLQQIKADTVAATESANTAATNANNKATFAQEQGEFALEQGNIAQTKGNTAESKGNTAEQKGNLAESKGNVAEQKGNVAEQQGNRAQAIIDSYKHEGVWSATQEYKKNEEVLYNGSTYRALIDNQNVIPADHPTTWQLIAQRGVDGTGAVSSVNNIQPDANGNVDLGDIASVQYVDQKFGDVDLSALATKTELQTVDTKIVDHIDDIANPHQVTKAQVGLGNVDNVKQATKAEFDSHVSSTAPHDYGGKYVWEYVAATDSMVLRKL